MGVENVDTATHVNIGWWEDLMGWFIVGNVLLNISPVWDCVNDLSDKYSASFYDFIVLDQSPNYQYVK